MPVQLGQSWTSDENPLFSNGLRRGPAGAFRTSMYDLIGRIMVLAPVGCLSSLSSYLASLKSVKSSSEGSVAQ